METGRATYYADYFHRRRTASGVPYDRHALVAAHRRYPFGTILLVTNLNNSRSVRVRVVDHGPFGRPIQGLPRVLDLSRRAAKPLGYVRAEWGKRAKQ